MSCASVHRELPLPAQEALEMPLEELSTPMAGLFPEFEQLEAFAGQQLDDDFHTMLTRCAILTPRP